MTALRDVLHSDMITFAPTTTARQAIDAMREHHLPCAPVVDGSHVIGVISVNDLAMATAPAGSAVPSVRSQLEQMRVEDLMSPGFATLPPDADSSTAVSLMQRTGEDTVLVMDDDRLFGLVLERDLPSNSSLEFPG